MSSHTLGGRFVLEQLMGRGGMGSIHLGERLAATVGERFAPEERPRAVGFLLELVVGDALADAGPDVIAGRAEPRILAEGLRRTFVSWLVSEARRGPVLVVVEDARGASPP